MRRLGKVRTDGISGPEPRPIPRGPPLPLGGLKCARQRPAARRASAATSHRPCRALAAFPIAAASAMPDRWSTVPAMRSTARAPPARSAQARKSRHRCVSACARARRSSCRLPVGVSLHPCLQLTRLPFRHVAHRLPQFENLILNHPPDCDVTRAPRRQTGKAVRPNWAQSISVRR